MKIVPSTFFALFGSNLTDQKKQELNNENIYYSNVSGVVTSKKHINVPIFQRRYCWKRKQIVNYYKSLQKAYVEHHIGKMTMMEASKYNVDIHIAEKELDQQAKEEAEHNDSLIVIDGQQRITTALLYFIAERDFCAKHHLNISNQCSLNFEQIFFNVSQLSVIERLTRDKQKNGIQDGEKVDIVQFSLSHEDRKPFLELLFGLVPNECSSMVIHAYNTFSNLLHDSFQRSNGCRWLVNLHENLLHRFKFVQISLDSKSDEQSMYMDIAKTNTMSKYLFQINPQQVGMDLGQSDLIRNKILQYAAATFERHYRSQSLHQNLESYLKDAVYDKLWLPIEKSFPIKNQAQIMDDFFGFYLDMKEHGCWKKDERAMAEAAFFGQSLRHQFEQIVTGVKPSLYASFVSYLQVSIDRSSPLDAVVSILNDLRSFIPLYFKAVSESDT